MKHHHWHQAQGYYSFRT